MLADVDVRGSCRCATPPVLAAPHYRRRRLRVGGDPGSASPADVSHRFPPGAHDESRDRAEQGDRHAQ